MTERSQTTRFDASNGFWRMGRKDGQMCIKLGPDVFVSDEEFAAYEAGWNDWQKEVEDHGR